MESLNSLIRDAGPDDQLARTMEAIIDSGLILYTRDGGGRFVQLSETLGALLDIDDERGARQPGDMKVSDEDGRAVAGVEYPHQKIRANGRAHRNVLRRLERGGKHIWFLANVMPLDRTDEGYSSLTIGMDVTAIVDQRDAWRRTAAIVASAATSLAAAPTGQHALIDLLRAPVSELVPLANVSLVTQHDDRYALTTIHHGFGVTPIEYRSRITQPVRDWLEAAEPHANLNVRETDIYGAQVVAELPNTVRSVIVAPGGRTSRGQLLGITAVAEVPQAFSQPQIEALGHLARLAAAAFQPAASDAAPLSA